MDLLQLSEHGCIEHLPVLSLLSQGVKQTDHFGFICRDQSESGPGQYMCYVFQCASESLVSYTNAVSENNGKEQEGKRLFPFLYQVDEVMLTLKQAFSTAAALQSNKTPVQLCEACPMHDLHKLCERIEGKPHDWSRTCNNSSI